MHPSIQGRRDLNPGVDLNRGEDKSAVVSYPAMNFHFAFPFPVSFLVLILDFRSVCDGFSFSSKKSFWPYPSPSSLSALTTRLGREGMGKGREVLLGELSPWLAQPGAMDGWTDS